MVLAWVSAAFVLGVVAGTVLALPGWLAISCALALGSAAWLVRRRRHHLPLLILGALFLGCARAPHGGPATPGDAAYYTGSSVTMSGTVSDEPDVRDISSRYRVAVSEITARGATRAVTGTVEVVAPRAVQLEYGDRVQITGHLTALRGSGLGSRSPPVELRYPRIADLGATGTGPGKVIRDIRSALARGIDRWLPEPEAALLIAITLGARSASLGDLAPTLIATGLIHLIAISGIKVALVAGMLYGLARRTGTRIVPLVSSLAGLWFYVALTGATASGVRSAVMWSLVFFAAYLGRGTVAVVSLACAAAAMVVQDPQLPWNIGFQLSFLGTFAIVAFSPPLQTWFSPIPSPFREAFCTTLAAQVGTLPVVIAGFRVVSLTGPLANTLALPLLPALIVLGFLLGMCSALPVIASPLAMVAFSLVRLVIDVAEGLARLPGTIPANALGLPVTTVYFAALGVLSVFVLRRTHWHPYGMWPHRGTEFLAAGAVAAGVLSWQVAAPAAASGTRVDWLGTGHAVLVQSEGRVVLIDGSPHATTLLERVAQVVPYTTHAIDLLIVTDPSAANAQSFQALAEHYAVGRVLDVGAEYPSYSYAQWRALLRTEHIPVFALRTGAVVRIGHAEISALAPDAPSPNPHDSSGILRVAVGHQSLLIIGVASRTELEESVFRPVTLKADELLAGGSDPPRSFLSAVSPSTVWSTRRASGSRFRSLPDDGTAPLLPSGE